LFSKTIISWYSANKRKLPWRDTKDPYKIWLSEIILQQTRVNQGMAYYKRFIETYPEITSLASAHEDEVLKLWQGLGYYSRARNMHATAKEIMKTYNGVFPSKNSEIRSLKGIGEYTAAAISSFAFNEAWPVVDGNVFRVLSRYLGIYTDISSSVAKKEFTQIAGELMHGNDPAIFNQAIMEFGALMCKPVPNCSECPLAKTCHAFITKNISVLPAKLKKQKTRKRYFNYIVLNNKNHFFIRQRKEKDIWSGLHDFPLIETNETTDSKTVLKNFSVKLNKNNHRLISVSEEYKHILSHQHIYARFFELEITPSLLNEKKSEWKKVNAEQVREYAVPRLIEKYLEDRRRQKE
jgi:A/G-specific adenine glycosylase